MTPHPPPPEGFETWRMDAYYYGFDRTGEPAVDKILSAVACAGKAFHNTESWGDEASGYNDALRGETPVQWIQFAADDARSELARLRRIEKAAKACDRIYSGSFQGLPLFCNFLDGEPVDAAPLFNELKAALEAKP